MTGSRYDIARGTTGGFSESRGSKDPIFTRHVLPIHSIPLYNRSIPRTRPFRQESHLRSHNNNSRTREILSNRATRSRYTEAKPEGRNQDARESGRRRWTDGRGKKKHRWNSSRGPCIGIGNIVVSETRWNRGQPEANASNYSRGDRFPASRMIVTASSPFLEPVYSNEITREPAFPLAAIL